MSELNNLIGCKISLISNDEVRYDGVLFNINAKEAAVILKDVKCLGTEDRVTDPSKIIAGKDIVTPFLSFSGQDIKDLYVDDTTVPSEPELPAVPPTVEKTQTLPPAPPASKTELQNQVPNVNSKFDNNRNNSNNEKRSNYQNKDRVNNNQRDYKQSNNNRSYNDQPRGRGYGNQNQGRNQNYNQNRNSLPPKDKQQQQRDKETPNSTAGTGEHLLKRWENRPSGSNQSTSITNANTEFDFNAGLTSFNKEAILAEVASSTTVPKEPTKYNKLDFFDNISCDQVDRAEGRSTRLTFHDERKLNQDTFGVSSLRNGYRGRGRG
eukprot:gene19279-25137_t